MGFRENFINELFKINESNFNKKALELFNYQYLHNAVYARYVDTLKKDPGKISSLCDIPYLPVTFFKSETVKTGDFKPQRCFLSSGTTGAAQRSKHYLLDPDWYEKVFMEIFRQQYGSPSDYIILALVPSYEENPDSSLLYMIRHLIMESNDELSSFISLDFNSFLKQLPALRKSGKKLMLIGVAFALLQLAEAHTPDLHDFIIMETGGMKGKREEMIKQEFHEYLKKSFGCERIHSEYGMTELLSQAYSKGDGVFRNPSWMKVLVRSVTDPFDVRESGRGGVNLIDLANVDSCAFIEIQDMALVHDDGRFEMLGRLDHAEIRGCNLLYF